jgi:murein DD-endopeptidase MepM/ murein hydrolase activator NlpD
LAALPGGRNRFLLDAAEAASHRAFGPASGGTMGRLKSKLAAVVARAFMPREFLIRSDGKIKYLTVTTRTQLMATAGAAALVGWIGYSSVSLLINTYALSGKDTEIQETKTAYASLLSEVEKSYEQFRQIAQNLEDQRTYLTSLKPDPKATEGGSYEQRLAAWQEAQEKVAMGQEVLQKKVKLVETDLRAVAVHNQVLTESLVSLQEKLRQAESEKMRVADLGAHIGERLRRAETELATATEHNTTLEANVTALRQQVDATKDASTRLTQVQSQLASALERSTTLQASVEYLQRKAAASDFLERQLAAARSKLATTVAQAADLETTVHDLQGKVSAGESAEAELAETQKKLDESNASVALLKDSVDSLQLTQEAGRVAQEKAEAARVAMQAKVGELETQLASLGEDNSHLVQRIQETQQALAAVVGQRDALQLARAQLTGKVGKLEERLASIQQTQQSMVQRIAERTRNGVEEVEKTVALTGIDVDGLLARVDEELGQGGPFIPYKTDAASDLTDSAENDIVLASVAGLDDEVERWEKLQFVLRSLPLAAPLDQFYMASRFGRRIDPLTRRPALHEGLDLASALRSPILATAPGKVVFAGWRGSYGRMVEIDHGLGIHTRYAHMHSISVKVGDEVDYRQKIGLVGSSGRSTGPHVHYEVRVNGRPFDPANFLKAGKYVFKG